MFTKTFKLCLILLGISFTYSQTYEDVVRYNSFYHDGSSRFNSMGGAFGSLGGDLSSISINPAGSSVFLESEFGISLNYKSQEIDNSFNSSLSSNKDNLISFNQAGFVLVYENRKSKFSVAYNINRLNDFNDSFSFRGKNKSGIDNYFLNYADGIPYTDLLVYEDETIQDAYKFLGDNFGFGDQQAFLGYQSYIINEDGGPYNNYVSNAIYNNLNQNVSIFRKGNHFKHSLNFSSSFINHVFFGLNVNFHSLRFEEDKVFKEDGYMSNSIVKRVQFDEKLFALGEGISLQLGSIIKIKQLRLGLSYTTPTLLKIEEENSQYIESDIIEKDGINTYKIDPNTINFYDEYKLTLPSKSTFSLSYIFGSKGLISLDYEITKYSNSKFDDNNGRDSYLNALNNSIKNKLDGISESIRIGGEYRIKNYNLRAGYFYYSGPDSNPDNTISGLSAGIGFNFGYLNIDLGLTRSSTYLDNRLYTRGLTSLYSVDKGLLNFYTTFTIKL